MKSLFSILAVLLVSSQALAAHVHPVYRFWNGRYHLLSTNPQEGTYKGYGYEGQVFNVTRRPFQGSVALYRCVIPAFGAEFLSLYPNCEGQQLVGTLGFVFGGQAPGTQPLYRCYQAATGDHLATVDANECYAAGYQLEGPLGYVYR